MPEKDTHYLKGIKLIDLAVLIKKRKALVISDLHLGIESSLRKKGSILPSFQLEWILERLGGILDIAKPKTIVINGDLKHTFGKTDLQEWGDVKKFLIFCRSHAETMLIRGNHDNAGIPSAKELRIPLLKELYIDGYYICHGDQIPTSPAFNRSHTIIIGHEHPAIRLSSGIRKEAYKAFIFGTYNRKRIIIMPSFSEAAYGTDIRKSHHSPFTKHIKDRRIFIVHKGIHYFGMLS